MSAEKNYILDEATAARKLERMALEILENNPDASHLVLAGVRESGSVIARNIRKILASLSPVSTELLTLSLDKRFPMEVVVSQQENFDDKVIIIIDDVANSGKTLAYALKPFLQFHPAKIQILVLVERSHKAFPIEADYVGLSIATTLQEHIYVEVEGDRILGAYLD